MVAITLLTHMPSTYLKPAFKILKFYGQESCSIWKRWVFML